MTHAAENSSLRDSLRDTASRFSREKLLPRYQAREADTKYDRALLREMGRLGLIAPELPEHLGGLGLSHTACGLITEQIAYGDFNVSYVQVFGSLLGHVISRHANPELGKHWVSRITAGDALVAIALTEPSGGSDVANLSTKAVKSGKTYLISAKKPRSAARCRLTPLFSSRAPAQRKTATAASRPSWCRGSKGHHAHPVRGRGNKDRRTRLGVLR